LLLLVLALGLYPTVLTSIEAFFTNNALLPGVHNAGLQNFQVLFDNPNVRESLVNTGWYVLFGTVITVVLGTGMALLLQKKFRGRGLVLACIMLPWALPALVEGVVWQWIYDPTFGVLDFVLKHIGLIHTYQVWLGINRLETIFLTSVVQIWQITPLAALLVLAGLQTIPIELSEAARVDGASWWQNARHVTLPLVRPALAVATVQALVITLNIFDQVYVLNAGATTANSIMGQAYEITFQQLDFGQGYALSLLATVVTVGLSLGALKLIYRKVEY
jgi:multiple sugar transport system permease protein